MKSSQLILLILVIAVIIGAVWFWFFKTEPTEVQTESSLGGEIFEKTQNPLEGQVPDTNPFADQPNPFGDKTNPIEKAYTNPF